MRELEREREKEIGETPLREKLEVRENLCGRQGSKVSQQPWKGLSKVSKVSSNLSKSFLMVAKKLALQRSFADPSTPGCKVVAAAISTRAPFTHRSSWGTARVTKHI